MAIEAPTIETERLTLRVIAPGDEDAICAVTSDQEVSDNTSTLPFPYERSDAEAFIERVRQGIESGTEFCFGVRLRETGTLIGTMGVVLTTEHERGDIGYLFGREYWGQGYASEACAAVVAYAFGAFDIHKLTAAWYGDNPASGRVLEKCGFVREGMQREHYIRGGRRRDSVSMGLLRREYEQR